MSQEPCMLVVSFDPSDPSVYQNLHACLQQLTQKSGDSLDTIMANGRFVVKRQAHPQKDQKLADQLRTTGADCRFIQPKTSQNQGQSTRQKPTQLVCPHCSHSQPPALECRNCGVVIAKAKSRHLSPKLSEPVVEQTGADQPATQPKTPWIKKTNNQIQAFLQWLRGGTKNHHDRQRWSNRFGDALVGCVVIFLITLALEIGLLLLANYLWFIYSWTPIGDNFNQMHPGIAGMFQGVFQANLFLQGGQASLISAAAAFCFGIVGRITHINRFIFEPLGFWGQAIIWILPVTALTALAALRQGVWNDYTVCFGLLLVPMLCLSGRCVGLVNLIVPEAGSIGEVMAGLTKERHRQLAKIRSSLWGWFHR